MTRSDSCQYCAKSFTQRDKMVVHTRLHTGERPYVCDVCGKGFCESGNLKKHMRVHGKEPPSVMHQVGPLTQFLFCCPFVENMISFP